MIKFCKKNQYYIKYANKHYIKKCIMFLNKKCCVNCNENHELWRCICFKWWQQMKQAFEIYKNRSFRYSEAFKYNCTFLQFLNFSLFSSFADSMNSLSLMNFLKFMNSFSSMNSISNEIQMYILLATNLLSLLAVIRRAERSHVTLSLIQGDRHKEFELWKSFDA